MFRPFVTPLMTKEPNMNVTALWNLAVASFFVARGLGLEPTPQPLEHRAPAPRKAAAMCLVEPVDPPPCAAPGSAGTLFRPLVTPLPR
jgi:hypothetical protein